jgi:membrane-associated protease RseP (regulator of RpoE activity)
VCHDPGFAKLSEKFVLLRMSHMRGVDIGQFTFDYNENWMGIFLDAEGRIYARYGSVNPDTRESHNTVDGLLHTMDEVLKLHEKEPKPAHVPPKPYRPEDIPAMPAYAKNTCIECHMVQTGLNAQVHKDNQFNRESLWVFPPPDNIGIKLDHKRGNVVQEIVAGSFAEKAAMQPGDIVLRVNGGLVFSAADFRFILNKVEAKSKLTVEVGRDGKAQELVLELEGDWRRISPIRQRAFQNFIRTRTEFPQWIFHPLKPAEKEPLGIAKDNLAIKLKQHQNTNIKGGSFKGAFQDAGFRDDDVIIAFDGDRKDHYPRIPQYYLYVEHKSGDKVEVLYLRDGKELKTTLVVP